MFTIRVGADGAATRPTGGRSFGAAAKIELRMPRRGAARSFDADGALRVPQDRRGAAGSISNEKEVNAAAGGGFELAFRRGGRRRTTPLLSLAENSAIEDVCSSIARTLRVMAAPDARAVARLSTALGR